MCKKYDGPTFGKGPDLYIEDGCYLSKYKNPMIKFPTTYNGEGPKKYNQNGKTYELFSGSSNEKC